VRSVNRLFAPALLALLGSAVAGPLGAAEPQADGRTLVIAAVNAPKHVSFVGQISTIRSGKQQALAVVAKIEHRAPDQTRRTYLAPQSLYGQFIISRGAESWDVDNHNRRVIVTENKASVDPVAVVDDVALVDANYRAVRTASDNVADRRVDVVDLVSKYSGERAMRLWIDADTHVVLAKEAYHSDGSLAWRTRYDEIRYTDAIPAQVFTSETPRGYATVHGRSYDQPMNVAQAVRSAGFKPFTPRYLPEGFSEVGAVVSQVHGVKNLHLIYSDGIRTISLFENATASAIDFTGMKTQTTSFDKHDAQYVRDGPTTLLAWREEKLAFALVGDLDVKDLVRIAISVVP
jgi:outer membrane lipoprotein-sorting protein